MKNVNEMTTAELVAEYNVSTGKNITRFASRTDAENRVLKTRAATLLQAMVDVEKAPKKIEYSFMDHGCPACGVVEDQTYSNEADTRAFCHHCSTEYYVATGKIYKQQAKSVKRSQAISETWNDKAIAEKRAKRHQVRVTGVAFDRKIDQVFNSVPSAFKTLGLPYQKHIAFRGDLVKAGRAPWGTLNFEIV